MNHDEPLLFLYTSINGTTAFQIPLLFPSQVVIPSTSQGLILLQSPNPSSGVPQPPHLNLFTSPPPPIAVSHPSKSTQTLTPLSPIIPTTPLNSPSFIPIPTPSPKAKTSKQTPLSHQHPPSALHTTPLPTLPLTSLAPAQNLTYPLQTSAFPRHASDASAASNAARTDAVVPLRISWVMARQCAASVVGRWSAARTGSESGERRREGAERKVRSSRRVGLEGERGRRGRRWERTVVGR